MMPARKLAPVPNIGDRALIADCVAHLGDIVDALENLQAHLGVDHPLSGDDTLIAGQLGNLRWVRDRLLTLMDT